MDMKWGKDLQGEEKAKGLKKGEVKKAQFKGGKKGEKMA